MWPQLTYESQAGPGAVARAFVSGNTHARVRNKQARQRGSNCMAGMRRVSHQKTFDGQCRPGSQKKTEKTQTLPLQRNLG